MVKKMRRIRSNLRGHSSGLVSLKKKKKMKKSEPRITLTNQNETDMQVREVGPQMEVSSDTEVGEKLEFELMRDLKDTPWWWRIHELFVHTQTKVGIEKEKIRWEADQHRSYILFLLEMFLKDCWDEMKNQPEILEAHKELKATHCPCSAVERVLRRDPAAKRILTKLLPGTPFPELQLEDRLTCGELSTQVQPSNLGMVFVGASAHQTLKKFMKGLADKYSHTYKEIDETAALAWHSAHGGAL